MRNNNKELKFEFGKRCTYAQQRMKKEQRFGLVRQFWSLSEAEVHQLKLSNLLYSIPKYSKDI